MQNNFQYEILLVQRFFLILFIKKSIILEPGNFISSNDLYDSFIKQIKTSKIPTFLNETCFYKEITEAFATNKIIVAKARHQGKRGFNGIQLKPSNNFNLIKNNIKFFELQYFLKQDFLFDVNLAKLGSLFVWVINYIQPSSHNFISTKQLYNLYKTDIQQVRNEALLPELTFYKEIKQALLAKNISLKKICKKKQKGYSGIKYHNNLIIRNS